MNIGYTVTKDIYIDCVYIWMLIIFYVYNYCDLLWQCLILIQILKLGSIDCTYTNCCKMLTLS